MFLNFAAERQPLAAQLGELPEKFAAWRMGELKMHRRIVYDVKANWKLIVLNYNECLHCPVLHPLLNRLTDYLGADNQAPTPNYVGGSMGFRDGAETMSIDGVRRRDYLPGLNAEQQSMVCYYAIYPNLLLSLHPDYMMTHTLWPKAVDRTESCASGIFTPTRWRSRGFRPRMRSTSGIGPIGKTGGFQSCRSWESARGRICRVPIRSARICCMRSIAR